MKKESIESIEKQEISLEKELEEKLYSRNTNKLGVDLNPVVSLSTILIIVFLTCYVFISQQGWFGLNPAIITFNKVTSAIVENADWVFILSGNFFVLLALYLAFSRLGRIRIGGLTAKPEFTNFAWYSMLISAGMGIGLMFWAVGEPLTHLNITPPIYESGDGAFRAMASTFLHWGLHPWAIYAVLALALSYFAYNKKLPLSLRSIFYPLFKDKVFGHLGDVIDVIAVLATLFGLATSLGLGVQQINGGMNYLFGLPISTFFQVVLIILITAIATISILLGIDKGVKVLSEWNMRIAATFMILIFLLGPTAYIIRLFSNSFGLYVSQLIPASFYLSTEAGAARVWQGSWTVFYLAWWISWSPFVAMFIARVSKGRTIREFVLAVLIVPSMLSFVWLSVFGGTAMFVDAQSNGALFGVVQSDYSLALFEMIQRLDIGVLKGIIATVLSIIATILVISFFVTSSDSGSIVVNSITSGGRLKTPARQRVFWAGLEGFVASLLLIIGGNEALGALQAAVIATGLPFAIVITIMSILLLASLQKTYSRQKRIQDEQMVMRAIEDSALDIDMEPVYREERRRKEKRKREQKRIEKEERKRNASI
jgi:choline/carnitine/betaine transport